MGKTKAKNDTFETVEPIGKRVLIRKDEDKKQTKGGIQLPDNIEIPTITGRIVRFQPRWRIRRKYRFAGTIRFCSIRRERYRWILRATTGFLS